MLRKEDPRFIRGRGRYVDDLQLPGMLHLADPARARWRTPGSSAIDTTAAEAHPKVKAVVTGADAGRAGPGLDADAVQRRAGRARHRQGALPGPGGRLRRRRGPLRRARRPRADRRRVRAPRPGRRRPQRARPGRAGHPRRPRRQGRQPLLRLGDRRRGRDRRGLRPRRRRRQRRTSSTRACTRLRWRPAARSPTTTRIDGQLTLWSTTQAPHAHRTLYAIVAGLPEHKIRVICAGTSAAGSATRCRSTPATSARSSARCSPASR